MDVRTPSPEENPIMVERAAASETDKHCKPQMWVSCGRNVVYEGRKRPAEKQSQDLSWHSKGYGRSMGRYLSMTPQEYIDRERRRAWTNLKRANERRDEKAAERLAEKLEVLKEIENSLETVAWHRAQVCRLMRAVVEVLAADDSGDADMAIAAVVDGEEYTMQDLVFGMCDLVSAWERGEEA